MENEACAREGAEAVTEAARAFIPYTKKGQPSLAALSETKYSGLLRDHSVVDDAAVVSVGVVTHLDLSGSGI